MDWLVPVEIETRSRVERITSQAEELYYQEACGGGGDGGRCARASIMRSGGPSEVKDEL